MSSIFCTSWEVRKPSQKWMKGMRLLKRGGRADEGQVVGFLHGSRGEQGETGLADGHDVLVIAEDGEPLSSDGAGGHVPAGGR